MINFSLEEKTNKGAEDFFVEICEGALPSKILFIHGNLASRRWWHPVLEEWKLQQKSLCSEKAFLFEFPGCGLSAQFSSLQPISFLKWAASFNERISQLSNQPVHLVGHSTGALVAALMASLNPELFRKLVLLAPVSPTGLEVSVERARLFERLKEDRSQIRLALQRAVFNHSHLDAKYFNELIEDGWVAAQKTALQIYESLTDANFTQHVKAISNKTLIIHGEKDEVLPLSGAQMYLELLPRAQLQILPGIGHSAQIESTPTFVQILRNFLGDTTQ